MSTHTSAWLAWSLGGLSVVMFVASFVLYFLLRTAQVPGSRGADLSLGALLGIGLFLVFPLVGALIASRRPENAIGWICLAVGLLWMLIGVSDVYGVYGVAQPSSVPFPVVVAGINNWLWMPAVGLLGTYLLLLFPDGRLPSRRWRPLAWLSGAVLVLASVGVMLSPGPLQGLGGVRNPFGLEGQQWLTSAGYTFLPLLPLCMLASALSLVLRFRRSRGEERQQIKWIAFSASVVVIVYLIAMVASLLSPAETWFARSSPAWLSLLQSAALLSLTAVPVAVGFAVLRYRLYDIDLLINRALVYGSLTATLALGRYVDDYGIGPWQFAQIDLGDANNYREYGQPVERSNRIAVATVGQVMGELIEPLDEEGIHARFLAEKGKGIHHVAVATPNFDETVERAERENNVILSGEFSGAKFVFLATERDLGVILEVSSGTPDDGAP